MRNFEEESTVFQSIDESLKEVWVEVYAPVSFKDKRKKEKKLKAWKTEIIDILKNIADLTSEEIRKKAQDFGWNINPGSINNAANFLKNLGMI